MKCQKPNHHCTCISIDNRGIMFEGNSGSGKTSLALGMLDAARIRNVEFAMVCDDQAMIDTNIIEELWVEAPRVIAGKVELHGSGIIEMEHKNRCQIHLICELVEQVDIVRFPEKSKCNRFGVELNYVQVPKQHEAQSIRILLQELSIQL